MTKQLLNIIFSISLLPMNFCCAFWLVREAINLTGMTFNEFLSISSDNAPSSFGTTRRSRRRNLRLRQRFLAVLFKENSSDPQRSIKLTWAFGYCTLLGAAALALAIYTALRPEHLKYAFFGNLILLLINLMIAAYGKVYRRNHPLDEMLAEKLAQKRSEKSEEEKRTRRKHIFVYSLVGAFFFGILLFFMLLISGIRMPPTGTPGISEIQNHMNSISREEVSAVLHDRDFETQDVPVTYWEIDENKLMYICAGVKNGSKFEYYEYTDNQTTDLVYNQISYSILPELEPSEREMHETLLPSGNKMFTAESEDMYHLVMYQGNIVIYAYSPDSLDEIKDILVQLGCLKNE